MTNKFSKAVLAVGLTAVMAPSAQAMNFEVGGVNAQWTTTLTESFGIRAIDPSCALTGDPTSGGSGGGCGAAANTKTWGPADAGSLNYKKWQPYTVASKATTELLLNMPQQEMSFLGRASFVFDAAAADTARTGLGDKAMERVVHNEQLYDLWLGKKFHLGDVDGRVRVGNQVVNWGESLFLFGGINATNSIDYQKALIPGTQIKEFVLPAPMVSVAANVAPGVNVEGYYQFMYNKNIYPPVGSYWSAVDILGPGRREPIFIDGNNFNAYGMDPAAQRRSGVSLPFFIPGIDDKNAGDQGQYGISAHYKAAGSVVDYGLYFLNYHDKAPVLNFVGDANAPVGIDYQWSYRQNRKLFGASTNFPLGDWAIGSEFSYRPKDAISLSGCYTPGQPIDSNVNANPVASGNCPLWKDEDHEELHVTGLLQLDRSDYPQVLVPLGADTAFWSIELAGTRFGGINKNGMTQMVNGVQVVQLPQAGYTNWMTSANTPRGVATEFSGGGVMDFNWTYDGSVIKGWQVTPGITYYRALFGNTPTLTANYLQGASSFNFYLLFNQNPTVWQAGLNFTMYLDGHEPSQMPNGDRDFIGGFVAVTF